MLENSFKNKESIMRRLASDYQKSKIIELKGMEIFKDDSIGEAVSNYMDSKGKYRYYYSLQTKIDYILERLDWEYSNFLKREFFNCAYKDSWWHSYYSRSTYYRIKNKAMDIFLGLIYV